jgi:hypothetical protein
MSATAYLPGFVKASLQAALNLSGDKITLDAQSGQYLLRIRAIANSYEAGYATDPSLKIVIFVLIDA